MTGIQAKKTFITIDAWRIVGWPIEGQGRHSHAIQHRCFANRSTEEWSDRWFHADNRGSPCSWCTKHAPEGIQVLFLFLKDYEYYGA
jgi:hypothetical protein